MNSATNSRQAAITAAAAHVPGRQACIVGGADVAAADGQELPVSSPIDGSLLGYVPNCGAHDVDRAVRAARAAFDDRRWAGLAPRARKAVLLRLADLMERDRVELAVLETRDMGMPVSLSLEFNVTSAILAVRWYAEAIDKIYDEVAPAPADALATITREPIGVAGVIVPWNFPLMISAWKLGPALALGNSVVLKPAEQASLSLLHVGRLAREAGLPDGVLNVVTGDGPTAGQALALHPDVDALAFTGSGAVGRQLLRYAADSNMKRVSLECGGKTPSIVLPDAYDLDRVADVAVRAIFTNQGQVCNAASRLLVDRSIHDDLVERVLARVGRLRVGNPLEMATEFGCIVDETQLEAVAAAVAGGLHDGATLAAGGHRLLGDTGGCYYAPTVLDGVAPEMAVAREEIFGPVLSVLPFDGTEQAIAMANDSVYGLGASVWTSDLNSAHRIARRMRAGTVFVNCFGGADITVPFGGYKESGNGRDRSLHAFDKFSELKTTWVSL